MYGEVVFTRVGDWSEVVVRSMRTGWLVVRDSRISGEQTGTAVHLPYGGDFGRGRNLREAWNSFCTYGDALIERAEDCRRDATACGYYRARVVTRGYVVQ